MRAFDAHAVTEGRVPSLLLMENAGRGATDVLIREVPGVGAAGARVVIVCGSGNNGGDGFVVARHLLVRGAEPAVFLAGDVQRLSADARASFDAWRGVGGQVHELVVGGSLSQLKDAIGRSAVVVDALVGTGLDRPIDGWLAQVVGVINAASAPRFAIDVPSGLDADTGAALGVAVEAHVTVTFAHHKLGLLTPNGSRLAGRVHVVDIGVPGTFVARSGVSAYLIEAPDVSAWLVARPPGEHKTAAGHVVIVAGSPGKIGAPQLVARGAMRAGAGVATIATWPEAAAAIESRVVEVMTARIERQGIAASLQAVLEGKRSLVVGPGFGVDDDARVAVDYVLSAWRGPTVVDADALTLLAGRPGSLRAAKDAVLTPHPGEAGRLLGKTTREVEADRFGAARELVTVTGAVVVLKGAHTIIASPDGRVSVSPIACPALATAGSGDVLAGIIGATACSLPPFEAACAGVMLHARAGEAWSRAHGGADRGMLASEIADSLTR
jgi:NAD(P)H-hydrate epimerase